MSEERKKELIDKLASYVVDMEDETIADLAQTYLDEGYDANDGIMDGLVRGMNEAGKLYDEEEYYIAELLLCSDAMYEGIGVLKKGLEDELDSRDRIKAVIGVIEGDTHDIGKNLVKIMLETAGFEMIDLGKDVKVDRFIDTVVNEDVKLVCMSSLMTTTMYLMKDVIDRLKEMGIKDKVKVMVGGGPVTQKFANEIGADGYSDSATEAVKVACSLFDRK